MDQTDNTYQDQDDCCDTNPLFAVICSFIEQFGNKIDLELDIESLKSSIENQESLNDSLVDLHVKLIKKIRRYFVRDQWEKVLVGIAAEYSYEDANEIESLGYLKTKPSIKLELLSRLFDAQFECDQEFKALVNAEEANKLRLQPTGRDVSGNTYWHSTDKNGNLRVFQQEPSDDNSWIVVCRTFDELGQLIEKLQSNEEAKSKNERKILINRSQLDTTNVNSPSSSTETDEPTLELDDNDEKDEHDKDDKDDKDENDDDDEFAGEDEEDGEPVIVKRARTARRSLAEKYNREEDQIDAACSEEDKPCQRCDRGDDPECILLCDMCDDGYHLACCVPPLKLVPDGDWFCPPCEHGKLTNNLEEIYKAIKSILDAKERERIKRERLRANAAARRRAFKEERIKDEIVPDRRQRDHLRELNEPLAVQKLDEELEHSTEQKSPKLLPSKSRKRTSKVKSKWRRRKRYSDEDEDDDDDDDDDDDYPRKSKRSYSRRHLDSDEESDDEDFSNYSSSEESFESHQPRVRKARASVSYKFKEYDELIKSAIRGESDVGEISDSEESEPKASNYGKGKDMATIMALAYQQENGLLEQPAGEVAENSQKTKPQSGKRGRRLNDLDAESEIDVATSDESFQASSATEIEEDEDDLTDLDSDESSIDEIVRTRYSTKSNKRLKRKKVYYDSDDCSEYKTRTRRSAAKQVSYKESTDEEDIQSTQRKSKKHVLSSDEDSLDWKASEKSDLDEPTGDEVHPQIKEEQIEKDPTCVQQDKVLDSITPPVLDDPQEKSNNPGVPSGSKKIRLEKRETRPVYTMTQDANESIDEITIPPSPVSQPKSKAKAGVLSKKSTTNSIPILGPPAKLSSTVPTSNTSRVLEQPVAQQIPNTAIPKLPQTPTYSSAPAATRPVQQMNQTLPMPPRHPFYAPMHLGPPMYHHPMAYQNPIITHPHHHIPPYPYSNLQQDRSLLAPPMQSHPMVRNPISDLNHYCNQSTYPSNIFNSFNINVPPKNMAPPQPRPFYHEDEVRPPAPPTTSADRQRTW